MRKVVALVAPVRIHRNVPNPLLCGECGQDTGLALCALARMRDRKVSGTFSAFRTGEFRQPGQRWCLGQGRCAGSPHTPGREAGSPREFPGVWGCRVGMGGGIHSCRLWAAEVRTLGVICTKWEALRVLSWGCRHQVLL